MSLYNDLLRDFEIWKVCKTSFYITMCLFNEAFWVIYVPGLLYDTAAGDFRACRWQFLAVQSRNCLLYTSDAADE